MCDPSDSNDCEAAISGTNRYVSIMPFDSRTYPNGELTLNSADETLDLTWVRFASSRGVNQSKGVSFQWYNDLGTLNYVGTSITSDGGYLYITNVRPTDLD